MKRFFLMLVLVSLPIACDTKQKLQGKRTSIFALEHKLRVASSKRPQNIKLPKPHINQAWAQLGGNASHRMEHLALAQGALHEIWRVQAGEVGPVPLYAPPIIARGKVFVLDGTAQLHAFDSQTGKTLWQQRFPYNDDGFGGGLAYASGRVVIATGFGTIASLASANGDVLWQEELSIPFHASPIIAKNHVYFMNVNNQLSAHDFFSGRALWNHQAIHEPSSLLLPSAIAVHRDIVIAPYNSGEVYALRAQDRSFVWTDTLLRQSPAVGDTGAGFIAIPAIERDHVYLIGNTGLMVALNIQDGQRLWSQNIGGVNMPWLASTELYVLAHNGLLLCMSRSKGVVLWRTRLPVENGAVWYGPVLAGNRLWLTSSDGRLAQLSPKNGKLMGLEQIADGFGTAPVIANRTMFLLSVDMELIALRAKR